ncbi:N-acetylglucosamine kinase [Leucobacter soli]|uniref:N-acetylglucosamine kinase n=1 Tax=Leucobacter soli TaxID=2812850 RepID=UPI003619F450
MAPPGLPAVGTAALGLTTAPGSAAALDAIAAGIAQACGCREVIVCDDAIAAHVGALGAEDGISLTVGTGIASIATGSAPPRLVRVDGHGALLDDAGGAFWIGRRGLRAALRATDGRGPATGLVGAAVAAFGPLDRLPLAVHDAPEPIREIADFARAMMEFDGEDEAATGILDDAADELCRTVRAARRRLAPDDGTHPLPLALGGRVLRHTGLRDRIAAGLVDDGFHLRPALGDPLRGALLIGSGTRPAPILTSLHRWEGTAS